MKYGIFLLALTQLLGCVSLPPAPSIQPLLSDQLFAPPRFAPGREDVFAVSAEMQRYLETKVAENVAAYGGQRGLYEAMNQDLKLDYDSSSTKTAAQTFSSRSGNCLSLVLLSAAFAKRLGLPYRYQSVFGFDSWNRSGNLAFLSSHINLALGPHHAHTLLGDDPESSFTIDFLPAKDVAHQHSQDVDESTVLAMYFNNRAAEFLADGDVNEAYWWVRESLLRNPSFNSAVNTLAVTFLRHQNPELAQQALTIALQREPENPRMLSNMVEALEQLNRGPEAVAIRNRLASVENYQPYHDFDLGIKALRNGDAKTALKLFERELTRLPYDDQVHLAAAMAAQRLGRMGAARKQLQLALDNSNSREKGQIYAAKLEKLKSMQAH